MSVRVAGASIVPFVQGIDKQLCKRLAGDGHLPCCSSRLHIGGIQLPVSVGTVL